MERETISKEKLLEIMNQELHKQGDFEDCNFTSIVMLAEYDPNGCNWFRAHVTCSGTPAETCSSAADRIIGRAKAKYNIAS